jgi:hypothetical protein
MDFMKGSFRSTAAADKPATPPPAIITFILQ